MMVALAQRIQDGNLRQQHLFDSVVGQLKTLEKRWIIDIDDVSIDTFAHDDYHVSMRNYINQLQVEANKSTEMVFVKTKSGFHIITQPFNLLKFKERYPEVDVQKKNPTLLYLPNSLMDENI
jgi:hypothetical protein